MTTWDIEFFVANSRQPNMCVHISPKKGYKDEALCWIVGGRPRSLHVSPRV